jgi:hypothetical protein
MRILTIATAGLLALSSATLANAEATAELPTAAPIMTGAVNLDFAETAAGKTAGTMGIELDFDAGDIATVDLDFKATDGNALTLDTWTVGTTIGAVGLAFGDDNGLLPETGVNTATDGTLTVPAMTESLALSFGGASVAVGLTDWNTDVTDISNIQGAYTVDAGIADLTASVDHNRATKNEVFGGAISGLDLGLATAGGMMTYDTDAEHFAYEGTLASNGITAYINGDEDNSLQHIGGEYVYNMASGIELSAGVDYDTDAEDWKPMAGMAFSF